METRQHGESKAGTVGLGWDGLGWVGEMLLWEGWLKPSLFTKKAKKTTNKQI